MHHLVVAAGGFTGETRGEVLAHLAFAEYSRYLADCGSLAEVDRWCDESVALLPPDGEPLACNRLLWLHFLRSRPDRVAGRPIAAPGELMTDGLVYTVLVAATAVRLLSIVVFQAGACRAILDVVWPLMADDPDLRAQRRYLDLLPFRDGILADFFTVTILPSVECLFRPLETVAAHPGVSAIACATGGLLVGLPEETSLHEQAERIASLFCDRPLTGDDATPAAALDMIATSRYLHLAAHGTQNVDAPLFARVYLAGGAPHAYQILERDLRGLDNLHGLALAFLRAGARAVVGALWPVEPTVAAAFFTALYAHLAEGSIQVNAFRSAQNQTRARHPNYRDWGAFTYYGT